MRDYKREAAERRERIQHMIDACKRYPDEALTWAHWNRLMQEAAAAKAKRGRGK